MKNNVGCNLDSYLAVRIQGYLKRDFNIELSYREITESVSSAVMDMDEDSNIGDWLVTPYGSSFTKDFDMGHGNIPKRRKEKGERLQGY